VAQANGDKRAAPAVARAFADYEHAKEAVRALQAAQVSPRSISVIARSPAEADRLERDTGVSEDLEDATQQRHRFADLVEWLGRVESAVVPGFGAVLGTGDLWQDVAVGGKGHGSITGALVGLGVAIDEASNLEQAVASGQILLVVHGAFDAAAVHSVLAA
jgi:hypothetical protein